MSALPVDAIVHKPQGDDGKDAAVSEQKKQTTEVQIRWLIRRDMPEVLAIENRQRDQPWTEEEFVTVLRQRNVIGSVAESSQMGVIYGFMVYALHKDRFELLSMSVAPEVQRTGVGGALIGRLVDKLSQQRRRVITAEIHEDNLRSHLFFAQCGFKARCRHGNVVSRDGMIHFRYKLATPFPDWQCVNRIRGHFE